MQNNSTKSFNVDMNDFIERYNKSVGIICSEYIGKHLVIYDSNQDDVEYEVVNSLSEIKEPKRVTELYIDGLIITDNNIFDPFRNLEHIHGVPILNITDMCFMFCACKSLKSIDLGGWDTSDCTDMRFMFGGCKYLISAGDLGGWDTSNVTDMNCMFNGCHSLKSVGDLGCWDTSSCKDMCSMFNLCNSLTNIGDLSSWDTSNVADKFLMFYGCNSLTHLGKQVTSLRIYQ